MLFYMGWLTFVGSEGLRREHNSSLNSKCLVGLHLCESEAQTKSPDFVI